MFDACTHTHTPGADLGGGGGGGGGGATRTRISIGGVQDRDTLIEQSANYSNRTFTGNM